MPIFWKERGERTQSSSLWRVLLRTFAVEACEGRLHLTIPVMLSLCRGSVFLQCAVLGCDPLVCPHLNWHSGDVWLDQKHHAKESDSTGETSKETWKDWIDPGEIEEENTEAFCQQASNRGSGRQGSVISRSQVQTPRLTLPSDTASLSELYCFSGLYVLGASQVHSAGIFWAP